MNAADGKAKFAVEHPFHLICNGACVACALNDDVTDGDVSSAGADATLRRMDRPRHSGRKELLPEFVDAVRGALPCTAAGGRAWKGSTYRVNELGQEFFTPGMSGTIHPAESGVGSGATHITVGDIIIQGAGDARAVANEVKRMLDSELRFAIRGIHSDGHWDR